MGERSVSPACDVVRAGPRMDASLATPRPSWRTRCSVGARIRDLPRNVAWRVECGLGRGRHSDDGAYRRRRWDDRPRSKTDRDGDWPTTGKTAAICGASDQRCTLDSGLVAHPRGIAAWTAV